ncbi:hypothetical protein [Salinifilum aidingensis]
MMRGDARADPAAVEQATGSSDTEDGVKPKKVAGIVVLVLVGYAVFTNPVGSADMVGGVGGWLQGSAESVITFMQNLAG